MDDATAPQTTDTATAEGGGKCPVAHAPTPRGNRDWWPKQLNVRKSVV